jgi:hypothetical protein
MSDDEMTNADFFTSEELREMDQTDELRQDAADEARRAAEEDSDSEER